ncbi:MAG: Methylenetetrahydrofolate--tRNA-(uracil-5-)-methyltransferase TrmFO, partial [uncultured Sphingomonadaceae bacterium]
APGPHHRRRPRRLRSRMAACPKRRPRPPLRNAWSGGNARAPYRQTRRTRLLQQLPLGRRHQQRRRPAPPGDARPRINHHGRGRQAPRPRRLRARDGPRRLRRRSDARARNAPADRGGARTRRHPSCVRARNRRHRPAHRGAARRRDRRTYGSRGARLLRRAGSRRPPRQHRHGARLDGVALGQGNGRLHQLPARQGSVPRLRRRPARGREDRVQGLGARHTLFRRLHADRGHGRARPRDAALRPDEARRPRRPAHRPLALRRGPAPPRQRAGHALEHGRVPDQAQARRAGAPVPHHSRPGERRVRAARRAAPQHLHQRAQAARRRAPPPLRPARPLRRADHRVRGLYRIRRGRPPRRALRGRGDRRRPPRPAPANHRARRAA